MFEVALKFWFEIHGVVQNFFTKKNDNNFLMTPYEKHLMLTGVIKNTVIKED